MKHSHIHIILALVLTIAVTDYVWLNLLEENQIVAELESEKENKSEEESLRESRTLEGQSHWFSGEHTPYSFDFSIQSLFTGFVKHGSSFLHLSKRGAPRLFLLHCQIKIDC